VRIKGLCKPLVFVVLIIALIATTFMISCAAEPEETFSWQFQPYENPPTDPYNQAVDLGARVTEASGGRLTIDVVAPGVLGYQSYTAHQPVSQGLLKMAETAAGGMSEDPVFKIFDEPVFATYEEFWPAYEAVKADLDAAAAGLNLKLLYVLVKTPSKIQSARPLQTLDDFKGLKFRAWSPAITAYIEGMGSSPQVVPYAELYTALATGVAEANTLSAVSFVERKMWEVTPYFNEIPTLVFVAPCVVNLEAFNALPADLQQILLDEAAKTEQLNRQHQQDLVAPSLEKLQEMGATVVYPDQEVLDKSREVLDNRVKKFLGEADPEVKAVLQKALDAIGKTLD